MIHETAERILSQLDAVLDSERGALLKGDLEAIGALLRRKEALLDALSVEVPDTATALGGLKGKVMRNQALLDGALQGIRSVAGRLTALRRIRRTLETYDSSGRKSAVSDVIEHQVEKRA